MDQNLQTPPPGAQSPQDSTQQPLSQPAPQPQSQQMQSPMQQPQPNPQSGPMQPGYPYNGYPYYPEEPQSKYTMRWLGTQIVYLLVIALGLSFVAAWVDTFASSRSGLTLDRSSYDLISQSVWYCFAIVSISSMSLMLVEIAFRKNITLFQYILVALALTLFYLMLVAFSEQMEFALAYIIVSVMIIGLIAIFVKGIMAMKKAVGLTVAILTGEYIAMFILLMLGNAALLVGSLILFAILGAAMFFTLHLHVENQEITLK